MNAPGQLRTARGRRAQQQRRATALPDFAVRNIARAVVDELERRRSERQAESIRALRAEMGDLLKVPAGSPERCSTDPCP